MTVAVVKKSLADRLGFDLPTAVAGFKQQVHDHQFTEGVPAPTAHPIVEEIVRGYDGQFTIEDDTPAPPPPLPIDKYAEVVRKNAEASGINVGDTQVATDRDNLLLLLGAYNLAVAEPETTFNVKTATGDFIELDADQVKAVSIAAAKHVQEQFKKEAELKVKIDRGEVTDKNQVDSFFKHGTIPTKKPEPEPRRSRGAPTRQPSKRR